MLTRKWTCRRSKWFDVASLTHFDHNDDGIGIIRPNISSPSNIWRLWSRPNLVHSFSAQGLCLSHSMAPLPATTFSRNQLCSCATCPTIRPANFQSKVIKVFSAPDLKMLASLLSIIFFVECFMCVCQESWLRRTNAWQVYQYADLKPHLCVLDCVWEDYTES